MPALLARARARDAAEGLAAEFTDGDAERLPFADASFDAVYSCVGVSALRATAREFVIRFADADEFADFCIANYGPTLKAAEALGDESKALRADLAALARRHADPHGETLRLTWAYLETVAIRAPH